MDKFIARARYFTRFVWQDFINNIKTSKFRLFMCLFGLAIAGYIQTATGLLIGIGFAIHPSIRTYFKYKREGRLDSEQER